MSFDLRRALASGAVTTLLVGAAATSVITPALASAADQPAPGASPACDAATAALASAQAGFEQSHDDFVASARSMGVLMKAAKAEARAEGRSSRKAVRALREQLRGSHDKAERAALRDQIAAEVRDIQDSHQVLTSKKALVAQVKAARAAAKASFRAARIALHQARGAEEAACGDDSTEPTETEPPEPTEPAEPTGSESP